MKSIKAVFYNKTTNIVIVLALAAIMSLPISARPADNDFNSETYYFQLADMLSEYLIEAEEVAPLISKSEKKVEIYSENNKLVRFGKSDDPVISNLLTKSDYLTVIDGVEYYKLNS